MSYLAGKTYYERLRLIMKKHKKFLSWLESEDVVSFEIALKEGCLLNETFPIRKENGKYIIESSSDVVEAFLIGFFSNRNYDPGEAHDVFIVNIDIIQELLLNHSWGIMIPLEAKDD